jgi:Fic family protein
VENAHDVYEQLEKWDPASLKDLLMAHKVLMKNLVQDPGEFRSGGAGVMKGNDVVHMAPPASMVPTLINQLLKWVKTSKDHPLITSSIFHYEFEYIHPFADGNGRMGRLWQTLILNRWNPHFAWLPVENIIHKQQKFYYVAIESDRRCKAL